MVGKSTNGSWTLRKKVLAVLSVVIVLVGIQLIINHRLMGGSIELLEESPGRGFAGVGIASDIKLNVVRVSGIVQRYVEGGTAAGNAHVGILDAAAQQVAERLDILADKMSEEANSTIQAAVNKNGLYRSRGYR